MTVITRAWQLIENHIFVSDVVNFIKDNNDNSTNLLKSIVQPGEYFPLRMTVRVVTS